MTPPEEPFLVDGTRETLAPLLDLRAKVWERLPPPAAGKFDLGLFVLSGLLDTLRWRHDVDAEATMERVLGQLAEYMHPAIGALGDTALEVTLEKALGPVREHLALARRAPRIHAGAAAVVKLSAEEYLLLCVTCAAAAERLRAHKDGVAFSRGTGAVSPPHYPRASAAELFARLERDGAGAVCAELDKERRILGYCPECGALYCPAHYETREVWSGSWLESLYGTCAKGHRREIA